MSGDVERRLPGALGRPRPSPDATARARAAVLAALPPPARRFPKRVLAAAAAALVAVALGAAALAATGTLHVDLGAKRSAPPAAPTRLRVPAGTHGIALVAGGRLWLATRRGLRIEGLPVSAAELSPRALYAVVGLGSSLVALAPGPRRAWTHETGGRVLAAAWSPDGLKIAYVVRTRRGRELRLIEGDGDHDRLLARDVEAVKPVWRQDSLAIAYVRGDARRALLDFGRGRTRVGLPLLRRAPARAASPRRDGRVAVAVGNGRNVVLSIVGKGRALTLLRVAARPPTSVSWR
jgi:hypothetical protein